MGLLRSVDLGLLVLGCCPIPLGTFGISLIHEPQNSVSFVDEI